ncbi:oligosaccharide flippase family protein [Aeromonas caviae]|uniref:oligosaccharide flippase family protein n=1 Tax=Aeromonas caviae TaxID=648 RepID=UPI0028DF883B|nr:oligosaccharide flippase family protein [Aeromonas caviae]MDT8953424.1 oligosaccharide flippase family protein [Aeromonas caviae]
MRSLLKKIVSLASLSAIAYFCMFFFEAKLASSIGPESYGSYQYVMSMAIVLSAFACLGLPQFAVRETKRNFILGNVRDNTIIFFIFPMVIVFLGFILSLFVSKDIALVTTLISVKLFYRRYYQGVSKLPLGILIDEFLYSIFLMLLVFVLPYLVPIYYQYFALSLSILLFFLVEMISIRKNIDFSQWEAFKPKKFVLFLLGGLHFVPFVFSQYGLRKIDSLIIKPLLGDESVGIYSASMKVSAVIIFVNLVFNSVVGDKLSELYYKKDFIALRKLFSQSIKLSTAVGFLISVVFVYFSENIIALFYGEEYVESVILLQILIVGQFINVASGPSLQLFSLTDESSFIVKISMLMLVLSGILFYFFTARFGLLGSAAAFVTTSLVFRVVVLLQVRKVFYEK